MPLVLTETKTTAYPNGWKTVTIAKSETGNYNGTKYYDLWFDGLPDNLNCRVWEARNKDGEEFSVANMIRYINPDILEEMEGNNGKAVIKVEDSPTSLVGKTLQIYLYKNDEGYTRVSQKVVPATPFQNPINNITEDTIDALKASTEKWENSRKNSTNGTTKSTTSTNDIPF